MQLEGSCHCGAVRFTVDSHTPHPYMRCYCSICRKVGGGTGSAINIMGEAATLEVAGSENITDYRVKREGAAADETSPSHRHFCRHCGSALWAASDRWPQWIYPFASAIDTPLPAPPERVHMMVDFVAPWVDVPEGEGEHRFERYPDQSIEHWHRQRGLYVD